MPEEGANFITRAAMVLGRVLVVLFAVAVGVTALALIAMPLILSIVFTWLWMLLYLAYPVLLILIAYYVNGVIHSPETTKGAPKNEDH